ncbi:MAG: 1-deoxy-D-xylulose-5-phosphate reductoisomerase [Deinococcales bacterium]
MTRISILGSTGSIGTQTLEVARWRDFEVVGLAAGRNFELAVEQAIAWKPEVLSVDKSILEQTRAALPDQKVVADAKEVAVLDADVVVGAIPGLAGLEPTRAALAAGRHVALANKEAMVCGGRLMWQLARDNHAKITPVDSEHSALYQCLVGERIEDVAELILTASGGPFRDSPKDLSGVTPAMALKHPNWVMGAKVTIDSSTLMNKGLEVLEAHYLYEFPLEQIQVLIQPGSIIHSMVRFKDNQIKAQLGAPDMRLPIQYAILTALETLGIEFPGAKRPATPLAPLNLVGNLELRAVNTERFPCLGLAFEAGRRGGVAPVALNAADEIAVDAFLAHKLPYLGIPKLIETVLQEAPQLETTWENIFATDAWARTRAQELLG